MKKIFLAVDVSKGYADFVILDSKKKVVENNFTLDDTFAGHNELYNILVEFFNSHPKSKVYAAVESTGGYENNWYYFLRKLQYNLPVKVTRLNPQGVHHTRKAEIKRNVTDKISAKAIGYHVINTFSKIDFDSKDPYKSLKSIWTYVDKIVDQKVQLLNQFESFLYSSHPQLLSYCKNGVSEWVLKLVKEYPTAKHLSRGHVNKIARIPYVTPKRAIELKQEAKHSVASSTDEDIALLIKDISRKILAKIETIKKWKKKLKERCTIPEVELLVTIPGIDYYSGIGLMINMGSIERFDNPKTLVSYWGLHPELKQSGDKTTKIGMSKQGRSVPRKLLFSAVFSSIGNDTYLKSRYEYYVEKQGKNKMCAIGILMHKLARMIYGMLKNNSEYKPEIDKRNRKNTENKDKDKKNNGRDKINRRYQEYDNSAPISRRETTRRKEQLETQDADASFTGSSNLPFSKNKIEKKRGKSKDKIFEKTT